MYRTSIKSLHTFILVDQSLQCIYLLIQYNAPLHLVTPLCSSMPLTTYPIYYSATTPFTVNDIVCGCEVPPVVGIANLNHRDFVVSVGTFVSLEST